MFKADGLWAWVFEFDRDTNTWEARAAFAYTKESDTYWENLADKGRYRLVQVMDDREVVRCQK